MKLKLLFTAGVLCLSTVSFAGEGWNTTCAAKTASFTNKINKAIELATLDSATLIKVDQLTTECHRKVNLGLSTYKTDACKRALEMVGVN